ncbi:MAG: efflux RND transporter periplasmic adaptor subunit [Deltaproteobacteria bacterium]|nr:efflux RND transporter periplasmic adaptor subunit [Deltaproteobacteria bacterium]
MKSNFVIGVVGAAALGVGSLGYWILGNDEIPDGIVIVNGRIEGDSVVVAAKIPGRIISMKVKEGDDVAAGQLIAELESGQIVARVEQAAAGARAAGSALDASRSAASAARQDISQAEAAVAGRDAQIRKARTDATRVEKLFEQGVVAQSMRDDARTAREVAEAELRAARERVSGARQAAAAAEARVAAATGDLERAKAALEEARATFGDTQIQAPSRGIVMTKVAEEGEVLAAGSPIVILVDLGRLHMKAYVPEPQIGLVKLGNPAHVHVDAMPERPFPATVREIASQSEFTPKEVQTREERVKQVVAVKLYLDETPDRVLVPGMPADAAIRWKADALWINPFDR